MSLEQIQRRTIYYEIPKAQAASLMGLSDVQEWDQDSEFLIVEHSQGTQAPPVPPLDGHSRHYTLTRKQSIYDVLGVSLDIRPFIQIEINSTNLVFHVLKEYT